MYEWNRLGEAKAYLKQAYHLRLKHGNAGFYVLAGSLLAKTYTALGDVHQSAQIMDRLKLEINPSTYPNLSKKVEFFQAQLSFGQGKTEQAVAWLKRVDIQPTDDIPSFVTEEYELLAHLLVLLGDHKAGHDLTKRLLHKAQQENRKPLEIEMLLLHSLLLNEAGEITESFLVLEQALKVAEQDGYIRTFIDKGHQMLELLNQYVKYRQNNHYTSSGNVLLSYVKQLLNMMTLDLMKTGNHSKVAIDDQLLTNKEILVLKLIQAGCSNKEIADELEISLSTVKTHINNLYRKLGVNNRVLAIQRAQELKIL